MNSYLTARYCRGFWRIARASGHRQENTIESLSANAGQEGWVIVQEIYRALTGISDIWKLEITKSCTEETQRIAGRSRLFAKMCAQHRDRPHRIDITNNGLPLRAVSMALRHEGEPVRFARVLTLIDQLQLALASVIAMLAWCVSCLWRVGEGSRAKIDADIVLAVHGEWSNRTRHILNLYGEWGAQIPVVILGRPRRRISSIIRLWGRHLPVAPAHAIRPFDLASALRSFPDALRLIHAGFRIIPGQICKPGLSDMTGMVYRILLGAASNVWWLRHAGKAKKIIYGHTGLADTTLLEWAQQQTGCTTIHLVHGISTGLNFAGHSNHAVFHCRHDAEFYRRLGGYKSCHAMEYAPPETVRGDKGILLLSNLIHPMNPDFRLYGVRDEIALLDNMGRLADNIGIARSEVIWKPHPVFESLSEQIRNETVDAVMSAGFKQWEPAWSLLQAQEFKYVITTPSTIALDVLKMGVLPVIVMNHDLPAENVLLNFPLSCCDPESLMSVMNTLKADAQYRDRFRDVWEKTGVSRSLHMEDINRL